MRQYAFIIIFFGFFGLLIGANIYLPQRFAWFFSIESNWWIYILSVSITFFMIAGLMPFSNSTSKSGSFIYRTAAITLGAMLYVLISVLLVDFVRLFTDWAPLTYGLLATSLALSISIYGIWNSTNLRTTTIEIPVNGLDKDILTMHLSDIHIGHFRGKKFLQKIVDQVNRHKPDAVFITGDLFDGRIKLSESILDPLEELKVPLFFVEGNHDLYTGVKVIKALLRKIGAIVLENEMVLWNGVQIVGLNHMRADDESMNIHASMNAPTIKHVLSKLSIQKDQPSILLHHSPDGIEYANEHGIDLYLSGHTHAGQLFPINYFSDWLFTYNKGMHRFNGTTLYVSEGAGTFGPPMRVATKSEITLVKLRPNGL